MRVAVSVDLGAAVVAAAVREKVEDGGRPVDQRRRPRAGRCPRRAAPGRAGMGTGGYGEPARRSRRPLPGCANDLTPEIMLAANIATNHFTVDTAKNIEAFRRADHRADGPDLRPGRLHHLCHQSRRGLRRTGPDADDGRRHGPGGRAWLRGGGGQQRRADHSGQHHRAPRGGDPDRARRRAAGLHADHRAAARGAVAAGPGRTVELERPWPLVAPRAPV